MGPTASGKSDLAVQLARRINCEIISVDSAMVYRGMDIGTAKPSADERAEVAHHLIDILDPAEVFSTGRFRDQALRIMSTLTQQGKIPLLVGGTMLYFSALCDGLAKLPAANAAVRRQIEHEAAREGWAALHRNLADIDPVAAARIHANDPQRIQRALEVYRISGKTLTSLCAKSQATPMPFAPIKLIIEPESRAALHQRIERRFGQMLSQGLIDEVQTLFERGDLDEALPSIRSVGYRQVWAYLEGRYNKETMIERAIIATRQLAKRQLTWLRREKTAFRCFAENPRVGPVVLNHVTSLVG